MYVPPRKTAKPPVRGASPAAGRPPRTDPRWIRTASDRAAIKAGCYFDERAAARVCEFFERFLCHSKGDWAKVPFLLEDWQRDFLSQLYGWKRPDGTRRFREAFLEVPKKNGKSTLLSGICLYALFEEPGAEVYCGAVDRSQASIIFDECARMAEASPSLSRFLKPIKSKKTITLGARNSKLVAMSADAPSKDGVSASCVVLDETHRFRSDALYEVMKYAGAARRQPLLINITTAGHDRHSLCYRLHERARSVLAGTLVDTEFLAVIYAADPETDDLDAPATWHKANPSMGSVLSEEDFAKAHAEAKLIPRLWNLFLRLRLNVWTKQETRWLPIARWESLSIPIDPETLRGRRCFAALDLSSTKDLTSLTLLFPPLAGEPEELLAVPYFFIPKETAEQRANLDRVPYPDWIRDGWAIGTEGDATDHEAIRVKLGELAEDFEVIQVGIDPWNAQHLASLLEEDGFRVKGIRQGYGSLSAPSKELERLLLTGGIRPDRNPVLLWCAGNVAVDTDPAGNIKPSKKRSAERIDGIVSLVMTLFLLGSGAKPKPKPSVSYL